MDLSSKLGELPAIQLPDFHLPDLQRLKQQLHKHTPSFSLKSLQHTFNVPSYTSFHSNGSSKSSSRRSLSSRPNRSSTSASSVGSTILPAAGTLQNTGHSSAKKQDAEIGSSSPNSQLQQQQQQQKQNTITAVPTSATARPQPIVLDEPVRVSSPISIPTHPSNYLIKKSSTVALSGSGLTIDNLTRSTFSTSTTNTAARMTTTKSTTPASNNNATLGATAETEVLPSTTLRITPSASGTSTPVTESASTSKSPVGHLFLQIVEARNLTLINPAAISRPYCLVEYDQNELMTQPALLEANSMGRRGGNDIFARAMAASSPKWRQDAEFDVVRPNQQISITIYDSGAVDEDQDPGKRFLGQVKLKPSEIHNRMIDSWFRLQGRDGEDGGEQGVTGEIRVTIKYQAIESRHLSTSDFDILRVLGVGSFGKVYQVRKKDTGRIYAMKVLVKKQVIEQKQVEHTIAERNVLVQALQSPFIVGLKFSFQTPTKLYLVQDFMNGGELFFHMQNEGTFSEPRARFYVAELVLALEHLHSCNVVYRDLKPENILLSSQGHIVLVDFGLCKQNVTEDERTHTFCGTTEYLAPEIVKGTGYGKAVDWWSLGVLLYEMLVGASPFADTRTEGTYHKILHQPVIFPSQLGPIPTGHGRKGRRAHLTSSDAAATQGAGGSSTGISTNAQDLIQRFLDKNPKTRLGSGPSGAEAVAQIKAHPFFKGIDFERLKTRDVTPPFQPHVGVMGDLDVSNFDAHFTDQTATLGMKQHNSKFGSSFSSSGSPTTTTTLMDGEAGSFLLQQQQRAANLYRQQQIRGDNATLSPNVIRGRRSSNSWSSYRTPSTDSLFTLSEPGSPSQTRTGAGGGGQGLQRSITAHRARALQQQQQQQQLQSQQQRQQQEYFKGFTFEGESILESLKRQEDEQMMMQQSSMRGVSGIEDEEEEKMVDGIRIGIQGLGRGGLSGGVRPPNQLFSGEAGSVDSIFGSM
ncbi:hypothetical protein BG015_011809 [Linnemannia schmuckeri]|uniref:non-specific serine/threonine protein kinase n=1 Tax=Linnemannia schmuckeri TaxID=64567 RepID=A0A9P5V845_9FUNG|nr:hypothetical protein BG015_011809 [Linnemannia schmuckeri]